MTNHNEYRDDYKNPRGDYPPSGGAADSYYNEASGGQQQQHNQPPPYGYSSQGDLRGRDDRRDDRRDDYDQRNDRRDDDRRDNRPGDYSRRDDRRDDYGRRDDGRDEIDGPDGERGLMGALAGGAAGAYGGHALGGKTGHSKTSGVVGALVGAFAGHKLQDTASDWKDERDEEKEEKKKRKDKDERRDDSNDRRRRRSRSRSRSRSSSRSSRSSSRGDRRRRDSSGPRSGHYAGHFTATSRDVRLDTHGDYSLTASCKRHDGSYQSSTISLDRILENDGGSFRWASGGHGRGPQSVTVQHGDTLRGIGARFGCSFEDISRHNGITNPDLIYPGQVLQIPGGGGDGGRLSDSAKHVRLVDGGQRLEAELRRDNGDWVRSSIILDERIKNDNGTLELV
ncbi:hypothetical protein AK830_g3372 [Neonectria ditissima]|uniref:LysM domain-containing protein n=1 Tax=Neonectria ditissima TaxID=78410 RepID=A0A0P7BQS9_9HYPO|nr:hypothetical protein AK830_g3372 [Neonectria ditissima]